MHRGHAPLLAVLLLVAATPARGQTRIASGIQEIVDEATSLFEAGRFREARDLYDRAQALGAPPEALYMVGRCSQELGEWPRARAAFRAYLAGDGLDPEAQERAEVALRDVEERLSRGTLVIRAFPLGARVRIDGELVGAAPLEPLDLPPGRHEVRVSADGFEPAIRITEVSTGGRTLLDVELAEARPPLEPPPASPLPPPSASRFSPWTWITLSTGIACVAGGTVSYVLGELDHREVADADGYSTGGPVDMSRARALELEESGDTKKLAGYVLWGIGGAALVTSTVLFVLELRAEPAVPGLSVGASPAFGGGVLTLRGSF